ncbi:hypothetical protein [Aeromonas veronii]|uniref:hypothetical protein n=1 Tax=Aeromonas veronii TaxID=654 RepID=UPI000A984B28|nr:hypothetical protein [Aeromonas veronii]MCJ8233319.1 hypothetical protein [Aeromonas veronii]
MALNLSKITGIDSNIAATLAFRGWSILAGGILLIIVPIYLSPEEQGYYFTFASIIATQVFFELGFNYVIVQMIGHESAGLKYSSQGVLSGDKLNLVRVYSLITMLKKWYLYISMSFFIIVSLSGYYFFSIKGTLPVSEWFFSWALLVFFSALNLFISPFLSVLEGIGLVGKVAKVRLIQSVIGYLGLFLLMFLGFGLNAIPILSFSTAFVSIYWIFIYHRNLFFHGISNSENAISWKYDIFPFQWRIAVSWLSGYFIFQLFNPVIFSYQGEIEAGKIGLTLTLFTSMLSLSMSWVTAKTPTMAKFVALNQRAELNSLFKNVVLKSGMANLFVMAIFFMAVQLLAFFNYPLTARIANVDAIVVLMLVSIANHAIFCAAAYMRAHKEEPMMLNSVVTGILNAIGIIFFAKWSSFAVLACYATIVILLCLPWTFCTLRRYYH